MGTHYSQLTLTERYQIQALNDLNYSARQIAQKLKRSNSTISRELRSFGTNYQAELAHEINTKRRKQLTKFTKLNAQIIQWVDVLLDFGFSPEQMAGRMRLELGSKTISTQTIYRLVHRQGWVKRLPRQGRPYRKRAAATAGLSLIPNRVDIDQRPAIVDRKVQLGHWEGDTVHGADGYFVTMVERVSKTFLFARVKRKTKQAVGQAITRLLRPYRDLCLSITFDNGGEFAGHERIAKRLGCRIYFAKPYQSWQRGLSENSNGLLRRYFPKKSPIAHVSRQRLKEIQFLINFRPRKTLNYYTPLEYLAGKRVSLMVEI